MSCICSLKVGVDVWEARGAFGGCGKSEVRRCEDREEAGLAPKLVSSL